jgi:hypothetical protein
MSERKNLTITQVNEVQKVGDKQIPKLSFKAKDGDKELTFFTFKTSLFDLIKQGQAINADVETSSREWDGQTYTDRKVVQVYVDGQPVSGKPQQGYRGRSPEELDQTARTMSLSYAKDLAVAGKIEVWDIINQAELFYNWVKKTEVKPTVRIEPKKEFPPESKLEPEKVSPETEPPASSKIDMDWLKASLEELDWADAGKWLKAKYKNAKGTTVKMIVESLTLEQQTEFVKHVQDRLDIYRANPGEEA